MAHEVEDVLGLKTATEMPRQSAAPATAGAKRKQMFFRGCFCLAVAFVTIGCSSRARVCYVDQDISPDGTLSARVMQTYSSGIGNFDYWVEVQRRSGAMLYRVDLPPTSSEFYPEVRVLWNGNRELKIYLSNGFLTSVTQTPSTTSDKQLRWVLIQGPGQEIWQAYRSARGH